MALPTLVEAFHATFPQVQWVIIAYLLSVTTLIVSFGRIGDLVGHRRVLLLGIALFTVTSVLCAIASTLGMLIAARMGQGLGAAIMLALAMAFVSQTVSPSKIGSAMGMLATTSAIGTALGPTLGGVLIFAFGWRAIFFVTAPLGVLVFMLARQYLPADSKKIMPSPLIFDVAGMILLAAVLTAYALAMTMGRGHFGVTNGVLLLAAAAGSAAFVMVERRVPSPLIRVEIFRNRVLTSGFVMSVLVLTVMMTIFVIGPFYLSHALRLNTAQVGLIMSVGPLAAAVTGIPAGRLADRVGAHVTTLLGLLAVGAGSFVLSAHSFGVAGYAATVAVISCGYSLFQTGNNTAVMTAVAPEQKGVVSGLLNLSRNLGLITGASLMAAVFAWASQTRDAVAAQPEAVAFGMQMTFAVATTLAAAALAIGYAGCRRDPSSMRVSQN